MDRAELMNRMTVLLGGRAAESLFYANVSTGAADDLAKATDTARSVVVWFGMDPKLGQVTYEPEAAPFLGVAGGAESQPRRYGEATADAIDTAVRELIDIAFKKAVEILTANRDLLDRAAKELLAKETSSTEDLKKVSSGLTSAGSKETSFGTAIQVAAAAAIRP